MIASSGTGRLRIEGRAETTVSYALLLDGQRPSTGTLRGVELQQLRLEAHWELETEEGVRVLIVPTGTVSGNIAFWVAHAERSPKPPAYGPLPLGDRARALAA